MTPLEWARVARTAADALVQCEGCGSLLGIGGGAPGLRSYCSSCNDVMRLDALVSDLERDPRINGSSEWRSWRLKFGALRRKLSPRPDATTPVVGDIIGGIGVSAFDVALEIEAVDRKVNATEDAYSRALTKKAITVAEFTKWSTFASDWRKYAEEQRARTFMFDAPTQYARVKQYDADRWDLEGELRKKAPKEVPATPEPKPDPKSVPGPTPGSSDAGLFGGLTSAAWAIAAMLGAAWLLSGRVKA